MKRMSLRLEREDILSCSELVVDVLSVTLNHIVDDCYLWYWRWWPHRRQYSFCHSEPPVTGAKPEQSQPSVYVQCLPSQSACDTSEWWEALFASDENELKPKAAATETTTATAYIIFFFILHCSKFVSSSTSKCRLWLKMYVGVHIYHFPLKKFFFCEILHREDWLLCSGFLGLKLCYLLVNYDVVVVYKAKQSGRGGRIVLLGMEID